MGYKVKKRTAVIKFAVDTDFAGAELKCLFDVPLKKLFELQTLAEAGKAEESFQRFGDDILIEWNVEDDDGNPVPATGEGLLCQPAPFANAILSKWLEAVQEPDRPFGLPPSDGSTSAEPEA